MSKSRIPLLYSTGVCWLYDDGTVEFEGGDVIEAIVDALSREYRFGGHTKLSVAEHSINVAERVYKDTKDPVQALQALFHEAGEGLGVRDMNSLLKAKYGKGIIKVEGHLRTAVFTVLGLPAELTPIIHQIDKMFAVIEGHALLASAGMVDWGSPPEFRGDFKCWEPERAAAEFRRVYHKYKTLWEASK